MSKFNIFYTECFYRLVRFIGRPIVKIKYRPIILNKDNINRKIAKVYAPNHRSTMDPYFVIASTRDVIHWAALKRFFTGEDSIFNNSKNGILRKLTLFMFKGLGAVPIDRDGKSTDSVNMLNYYMENQRNIGIFPEGTTNKSPARRPLLPAKTGAFYFAKENDTYIQPVAILWKPLRNRSKHKVIINYRPMFKVENVPEAKKQWVDSIMAGLEENECRFAELDK